MPWRVAALPDPVDPFRWRGLVETAGFYAIPDVRLGREFDPSDAPVFHKPDWNPSLQAAAAAEPFRVFLGFSQFPLWRVVPAPDGGESRLVEAIDMRFGTPLDPGFMASAVVLPDGRVSTAAFQFGRARPR